MKKLILFIGLMLFCSFLVSAGSWTDALDSDLWVYYSLNESTGSFYDMMGNLSATQYSFADNINRGTTIAKNAQAVNFTAQQDHINLSSYEASISAFSVNVWVYGHQWTDGVNAGSIFRERDSNNIVNFWLLTLPPSTGFQVGVQGTSFNTDGFPSLNEWHMITMTYDGQTIAYYQDGILNKTTAKGSVTINSAGTGVVTIGNWPELEVTTGVGLVYEDEFSFWTRNLTHTEVSSLWDGGTGTFKSAAIPPNTLSVTLNTPANGITFIETNRSFNATFTPAGLNLTNATVHIWNSNGSLFNTSINTLYGNVTNQTTWNIQNFSFGDYIWNVYGCGIDIDGTEGTCAWSASNFTFERQTFGVDSEIYQGNVHETQNTTFEINITIDPSQRFFSASLFYNGTPYIYDTATNSTAEKYHIKRTIDIPLIDKNNTRNFFWQFTFGDGTFNLQNSTTHTQTINNANITNDGNNLAINYTIYDEETLERIQSKWDSTFEWYLGSGTTIENNSFNLAKTSSFHFSLDPNNKTFYTDVRLKLTNSSALINNGSYQVKIFDFNILDLNLTSKLQELYLLPENNGTSVRIEVKDEGLSPLNNIYVTILRYYPGENKYRMVENRKTNSFGIFEAILIENNVKYKFEFRNSNNVLLKTEESLTISCSTSICALPFVIEDTSDDFGRFKNISGFDHDLTFNNETNTFTLTWNDNTEQDFTIRLQVDRYLFNGTSTICDTSSTDRIGRITCAVGNMKASYQAQVFRSVGGNEQRRNVMSVKVGDISGIFGIEGLMWSMILLLTLILMGMWSPGVGVALYLIGFVLLGVLGIIYIHPAIVIAEIVIGVLFIWAFKS